MPLDPQVQALLDEMARANLPPLETQTPAAARASMLRESQTIPRPDCVARVEERELPGPRKDHGGGGPIPVRVYRPEGESLPVHVYFHGGGWVIGDLDTHDGLCRELAAMTESVVVSVHYRLAPEAPYPAAPEDCYAATRWVAENATEIGGDASRLIVGGDSAGGNLAAVTALLAKERRGPAIKFQVLIYPIADCDFDTPSYLENATGYGLTRAGMQWFFGHYVRPEEAPHPHVSPLRADDLSGLPPAYVLTAEYDPLRDEGEAYAKRLDEAGVPVVLERFEGMHHGFVRQTHLIDRAREALARIRDEQETVGC